METFDQWSRKNHRGIYTAKIVEVGQEPDEKWTPYSVTV